MVVRSVLRSGVDVDVPALGGITALHVSSALGKTVVTLDFLEAGADPARQADILDRGLQTPVQLAEDSSSGNSQRHPCLAVFERGEAGTPGDGTHRRFGLRAVDQIWRLKGRTTVKNSKFAKRMFVACIQGQLDAIRQLHAEGCPLDLELEVCAQGIHVAASWGQAAACELLVALGSDVNAPNAKGDTPLMMAAGATQNSTDTCAALLDLKANTAARGNGGDTAMHRAAAVGQVNTCRLLKTKGAVVDARNNKLQTPLHSAAHSRKAQGCQVMVELGADIRAFDVHGWTALHWGARTGSPDVCDVMVRAGLQPNEPSSAGSPPLVLSADWLHTEATATLIGLGADPNGLDGEGRSVLGCACAADRALSKKKRLRYVLELMALGANADWALAHSQAVHRDLLSAVKNPLKAAAELQMTQQCLFFIDQGMDPADRKRGRKTAYQAAEDAGAHDTAHAMRAAVARRFAMNALEPQASLSP